MDYIRTIFMILTVICITMPGAYSHDIELCKTPLSCQNGQRVRVDMVVAANSLNLLEQLRANCNTREECTYADIGCEYLHGPKPRVRYTCVKHLPRNICSGSEMYKEITGDLVSENYPHKNDTVRYCRLYFSTKVSLELIIHDVGPRHNKLNMTIWYVPRLTAKWMKVVYSVAPQSVIQLPKGRGFDMGFTTSRIWMTFTKILTPINSMKPACKDGNRTPDCNKETEEVSSTTVNPAPTSTTSILNGDNQNTKIENNKKTKTILTAALGGCAVLLILLFLALLSVFIWKKRSLKKCSYLEARSQRPDILRTHFPSDGNIMVGDIPARNSSIYIHPMMVGITNLGQEPDLDSEESENHYESVTISRYTHMPLRPPPRMAPTYIEMR